MLQKPAGDERVSAYEKGRVKMRKAIKPPVWGICRKPVPLGWPVAPVNVVGKDPHLSLPRAVSGTVWEIWRPGVPPKLTLWDRGPASGPQPWTGVSDQS